MRIRGVFIALSLFWGHPLGATETQSLPGTELLKWDEEKLPDRIMDGAHKFVEAEISKAAANPISLSTNPEEKRREMEPLRIQLAHSLGVVDERSHPHLEFFTDSPANFDGTPASPLVAENQSFRVHQVRWRVFDSYAAEGLYINPIVEEGTLGNNQLMVLFPDAGETPEDLLGLTQNLPANQQIGLRFALLGFRILIPAPVNRELFEGHGEADPKIVRSQQTHREWIYRQAFQMGRHPIGYEVQTILAAVDWFDERFPGSPVTSAGYGSGARSAFYATAIDSRIDHAFVSGTFSPRDEAWSEPIDHNLFGLLPKFGDATVAAMILPRPLLIEHTAFPIFESEKGSISTPTLPEVEKELQRASAIFGSLHSPPGLHFNEASQEARGDYPSVAGFLQAIGLEPTVDRMPPIALMIDQRIEFDPAERHDRIFHGIEAHVQRLVDESEELRKERFFYEVDPALRRGKWSTDRSHETLSLVPYLTNVEAKREQFRREVIGTFKVEKSPASPRSHLVKETEHWTAWNVVVDVFPEFDAWGLLVIPKGIPEGEMRPVVVCQHGRNGVPRDTFDADKSAYSNFAATLAEEGYITFSPHNLYKGEDRYRWLDRKANLIGTTLFSLITASHKQFVTFLQSREEVDPDKIAFYGLSYGGESAMRLPALIPEYSVSICSGDFNQWTRKVADPDFPGTFMKTIEWEMPYWNMSSQFDYAELAGLIFPRPFFVERGHHDLVATDEWVAHEYGKVRFLYSQYNLKGKTGIEFFQGGHSVNGKGAFEFLRQFAPLPDSEP